MSSQAAEGAISAETSPATLIDQQQTGASPSAVEDQQQNVVPSTAVEDQLRKEIAGLEAEIRQLKLNQDPTREGVKHTLLREELAQIREINLNLRIELQVAQDGHRLLEEKYHGLEAKHGRCRKSMQKAIEDLSASLEPSNGASTNVVASGPPNAVQIKVEDHPPTFPIARSIQGSPATIFGQPSIRSPAEQPLSFTPGPFQNIQAHRPTSPFPSSCVTPRHFLAKVIKPAPPMFGNPKETIHNKSTVDGEKFTTNSPEFWKIQQRSFEEASRRDKTPDLGKINPSTTPNSMFNHISAPSTSLGRASSFPGPGTLEQGKKRKYEHPQGGW